MKSVHRPRTAERNFASAIVMNVEFSDVKNIISSLAFRFFSIAVVSDCSKWYKEERERREKRKVIMHSPESQVG